MNVTSSGLQCEVAYWPAMTLGGAAQVAAAHCPNERTLDPAVCSYNMPTYAPASRTMAFTPQCSPAMTRYRSVNQSVLFSMWPKQQTAISVKEQLEGKTRVEATE